MKSDAWSFNFTPRSASQREALAKFDSHDLLFLLGPAGGGKSHAALALALREVREGRRKKIILTRPLVTAGEEVGFLPGDLGEKTAPFRAYLGDILPRLTFRVPPDLIEFVPMAFLRGRTFEDAVMVLGEAQNATRQQIKLFLTRTGQNSKVIVEGDPDQSDLPSDGEDLLGVVEDLEGCPGVGVVDFDPSVTLRHPLVALALSRLSGPG
jgi:phosphate starvation-inducible PhoH-like protein